MTMKVEDIKRLAEMSRLEMTEQEMEGIANDFDSILAYVDQIRQATAILDKENNSDANVASEKELFNVMRDDVSYDCDESSKEKILENMPEKEGRFLKVDQIL